MTPINAGRLWAGGVATAVVAALIVVAGVLVARGVFDVPLFAPVSGPQAAGIWGGSRATRYAIGAAFCSLLATGLAHLLLLFTPRPMRFFSWMVFLATAIAVVAPFAVDVDVSVQFTASVLNLLVGVAIGGLVTGSARAAQVRSPYPRTPGAPLP